MSGERDDGRAQAEVANLVRGMARCACGGRMQLINKGPPPKGGRYHVCSVAVRDGKCGNKRLWNAKDVERHLLSQIDPRRVDAAFEPSAKNFGPSPREFDARIAELTGMKNAAIDAALRNAGKAMAGEYESRAESLTEEIAETRRRRDLAAAEERSRPHLPTAQSAIGGVAALGEKLRDCTDEERGPLRTALVQQLRTAFAEIVFRPHAIVGRVELPDRPKPRGGTLGDAPGRYEIRKGEDGKPDRDLLNLVFFRDDPEEMAGYDGGKGIVFPRFV